MRKENEAKQASKRASKQASKRAVTGEAVFAITAEIISGPRMMFVGLLFYSPTFGSACVRAFSTVYPEQDNRIGVMG